MRTKSINPKVFLYHYFEFYNSKGQMRYALFDSDMDMPVAYGSRNLVQNTIRHLNKKVTVIYYKPNTDKQTFYNPRFQKYEGQSEAEE